GGVLVPALDPRDRRRRAAPGGRDRGVVARHGRAPAARRLLRRARRRDRRDPLAGLAAAPPGVPCLRLLRLGRRRAILALPGAPRLSAAGTGQPSGTSAAWLGTESGSRRGRGGPRRNGAASGTCRGSTCTGPSRRRTTSPASWPRRERPRRPSFSPTTRRPGAGAAAAPG